MRRPAALAALALVVLLSPVTAWWLVGAPPEPQPLMGGLDYANQPLPLTSTEEAALGWSATVATALAGGVVAVAIRRGEVGARTARAAVPLVVAGVFCGGAWRVMTAGVIGANIGAGLVLLAAPIFLPAMVAVSILLWRTDRWG